MMGAPVSSSDGRHTIGWPEWVKQMPGGAGWGRKGPSCTVSLSHGEDCGLYPEGSRLALKGFKWGILEKSSIGNVS